jgi:glycine/D-amino acid oxidase-like deaminating enzyme
MISYWEQTALLKTDVLIAGAGITGLFTALALRDQLGPEPLITVIDRAHPALGASSRNAGFACIGSASEILDDLNRFGRDRVLALTEMRFRGLQMLEQKLGAKNIDLEWCGGYEILSEMQIELANQLPELNQLLLELTGTEIFSKATAQIPEMGLNPSFCKELLLNRHEGMLHSGKLLRRLHQCCRAADIRISEGFELKAWEQNSAGFRIEGLAATRGVLHYQTRMLLLCTNAYTGSLLPHLEIEAARGVVGISKPVPGLKLKGTFHYDAGYYYFRNVGDRFLMGGGRNLNFERERTLDQSVPQEIEAALQLLSMKVLPQLGHNPLTSFWAGSMAFGPDKLPLIDFTSEGVGYAARMGGMGVALAPVAAEKLAQMAAERYS